MSDYVPHTPRPEAPGGPSVATVVWGAIVVVLSAVILIADAGWRWVDPLTAATTLLVLAGVGLIVGGILASLRRRGPR